MGSYCKCFLFHSSLFNCFSLVHRNMIVFGELILNHLLNSFILEIFCIDSSGFSTKTIMSSTNRDSFIPFQYTCHYFFEYFCCTHTFSSHFGSLVTQILDLMIVSWVSKAILTSFFLLFKLDHFYWSILKFTDSFMSCPCWYLAHPVSFLFPLLNFSVLKFPFISLYLLVLCWVFLSSYSFLEHGHHSWF